MTTYETLSGLPTTGPWPQQFSATGHGTHREGFVVKFVPDHGAAWVGNFQPGLAGFGGVYRHPNGEHLLVVSDGQAYVVDPETRALVQTVGGAIVSVHVCEKHQLLVLDHQGVAFEGIGPTGQVWRSRRLPWDGFRNVEVGDNEIVGESWSAPERRWQPFRVDVRTGRSWGGAYRWPDADESEPLA